MQVETFEQRVVEDPSIVEGLHGDHVTDAGPGDEGLPGLLPPERGDRLAPDDRVEADAKGAQRVLRLHLVDEHAVVRSGQRIETSEAQASPPSPTYWIRLAWGL